MTAFKGTPYGKENGARSRTGMTKTDAGVAQVQAMQKGVRQKKPQRDIHRYPGVIQPPVRLTKAGRYRASACPQGPDDGYVLFFVIRACTIAPRP